MDIDTQILEKQNEINALIEAIAKIDDPKAMEREMLRAGAEAYMPYDPNTAHSWIAESEGRGKGKEGLTAGQADKAAKQEEDRNTRMRIAETISAYRQRALQDPTLLDKKNPEYMKLQNEVDLLHGKLYQSTAKNQFDKWFAQQLAATRSDQRETNLGLSKLRSELSLRNEEDSDYKMDLDYETKAWDRVQTLLGTADKQFQNVSTQLGKVFGNLKEGIENNNPFAINTAVKSMIQAIDDSVVRESEMGIYQNPELLETVKRYMGRWLAGESYTAEDIRMIVGVANATAEAVNWHLRPEGNLHKGLENTFSSRMQNYSARSAPEVWTTDQALQRARDGIQGTLGMYMMEVPEISTPEGWSVTAKSPEAAKSEQQHRATILSKYKGKKRDEILAVLKGTNLELESALEGAYNAGSLKSHPELEAAYMSYLGDQLD